VGIDLARHAAARPDPSHSHHALCPFARSPVRSFARSPGNDIHRGALDLCMENVNRAGVSKLVELNHGDVSSLELDGVKAPLVVTNPPWGQRLGAEDREGVEAAWSSLGSFLKHQCQGSSAYVLSGDSSVTKALRLKSTKRVGITVGNVSCKVLEYHMY